MPRSVFGFLLFLPLCATTQLSADELSSWRAGATKTAILRFVHDATTPKSRGFVPLDERFAVFDQDGTLWPEEPADAERGFLFFLMRRRVVHNASLRRFAVVRAVIRGDGEAIKKLSEDQIWEPIAPLYSGMSEDEFARESRQFLSAARNPFFRRPITSLGFVPMRELVALLQKNGFKTYICSGSTQTFLRQVSRSMFGIAPENVIGSRFKTEFRMVNGRFLLWRTPTVELYNDREIKTSAIERAIGTRPAFVAGNVKSGGDVAMMMFSKQRAGASLQLLLNHDDAAREAAYGEKNDESLRAAKKYGFVVASMKNDWKTVFSPR